MPNTRRAAGPEAAGSFSTVVVVGPGPTEVSRVLDLIELLNRFEPVELDTILLVDDSAGQLDLASAIRSSDKVRIFASPRGGRGDGWRGGLAANVLFGLRRAFEGTRADFVVKLDTDAMVIGPFSRRLRQLFLRSEATGIFGSCFEFDLNGGRVPQSTWRVNLDKYRRLVRMRRRPFPHPEFAFRGRNRVIRNLLLRALKNGWPMGSCAQGGGYVVRRELYDFWSAQGWLRDDLLWAETDLGEDVVVSLMCYAAGFRIEDDNGRRGVFGVQYRGLGLSLSDFIESEISIIHSVKMDTWEQEFALRRRIRSAIADR